jgi:hypothetical protein
MIHKIRSLFVAYVHSVCAVSYDLKAILCETLLLFCSTKDCAVSWLGMAAKYQCYSVDGKQNLLPSTAFIRTEDVDASGPDSLVSANSVIINNGSPGARMGVRDRVRKCCGAFGIGLCYGVTLATLLSLALVYVELVHVKADLAAVQHQLRRQRHLSGDQLDERQPQLSDVEASKPRDLLEVQQIKHVHFLTLTQERCNVCHD